MNTDQGSQFSAQAFVHAVKEQRCKLSMDGHGAWRDNVFVERLWRSVKYEEVYLRAYDSISPARQGLGQYLTFCNQHRPYSALGSKTPEQVYGDNLTTRLTAALSECREAPLKEWNMLSKQLRPPLAPFSPKPD